MIRHIAPRARNALIRGVCVPSKDSDSPTTLMTAVRFKAVQADLMHCRRIPTGFRLEAQGCEERATLGKDRAPAANPNAVASVFAPSPRRNPVGVGDFSLAVTQGSSFLAALGWRTQSLWDWKRNRHRLAARRSF